MKDDHKLLNSLRDRSPEAFHQLYEMYSNRMFRLAFSLVGQEEEAEDVVQEAFLRFIEKIDRFEGRSKVGTWLYRTTHNLSIDRLRRARPTMTLNEMQDTSEARVPLPSILTDWSTIPERLMMKSAIRSSLDEAIASISGSLRVVFLLRDVEELSTAEVARILEISPGAVKVRLHRARLLLRELLAEHFTELA